MKLNKIIIRNFRSYYGENQFELSDGLTLVIGDNGDGKTTFFEALEWLFDTSKINKSESNISEMRKMVLGIGVVDEVSVTMIFEHGGEKEICKKFIFEKNSDGSIAIELEMPGKSGVPMHNELIIKVVDGKWKVSEIK